MTQVDPTKKDLCGVHYTLILPVYLGIAEASLDEFFYFGALPDTFELT